MDLDHSTQWICIILPGGSGSFYLVDLDHSTWWIWIILPGYSRSFYPVDLNQSKRIFQIILPGGSRRFQVNPDNSFEWVCFILPNGSKSFYLMDQYHYTRFLTTGSWSSNLYDQDHSIRIRIWIIINSMRIDPDHYTQWIGWFNPDYPDHSTWLTWILLHNRFIHLNPTGWSRSFNLVELINSMRVDPDHYTQWIRIILLVWSGSFYPADLDHLHTVSQRNVIR